ncbi:unnamed protein product, partial [Adineta steineri]
MKTNKDASRTSQCLLFAPAEYFEDNTTKIQLTRTLSSSFRINTNSNTSNETTDEPNSQAQQQSPTSFQQPANASTEISPTPLVYVLCVPISTELECEWRGVTHTISTNKVSTSILPLNTNWKTTTIFLLTQQTNNLDKFEDSF